MDIASLHKLLDFASGRRTTTTDSSAKFIPAPRVNNVVTGECVALHRGRTAMVWQTSIRNADGKLVQRGHADSAGARRRGMMPGAE